MTLNFECCKFGQEGPRRPSSLSFSTCGTSTVILGQLDTTCAYTRPRIISTIMRCELISKNPRTTLRRKSQKPFSVYARYTHENKRTDHVHIPPPLRKNTPTRRTRCWNKKCVSHSAIEIRQRDQEPILYFARRIHGYSVTDFLLRAHPR